jgi:hypothetical protein
LTTASAIFAIHQAFLLNGSQHEPLFPAGEGELLATLAFTVRNQERPGSSLITLLAIL